MSKGKQTGSPYCKVCESHHSPRDPHNYKDAPSLESLVVKAKGIVCTQEPTVGVNKPKKVATSNKNVPTKRVHKPENVPTIQDTHDNVPTITRVSMRELNQGMAKHFTQLPFVVTKNGKDIARVDKI